jgi:Flp pilus assembly protein TadD
MSIIGIHKGGNSQKNIGRLITAELI